MVGGPDRENEGKSVPSRPVSFEHPREERGRAGGRQGGASILLPTFIRFDIKMTLSRS